MAVHTEHNSTTLNSSLVPGCDGDPLVKLGRFWLGVIFIALCIHAISIVTIFKVKLWQEYPFTVLLIAQIFNDVFTYFPRIFYALSLAFRITTGFPELLGVFLATLTGYLYALQFVFYALIAVIRLQTVFMKVKSKRSPKFFAILPLCAVVVYAFVHACFKIFLGGFYYFQMECFNLVRFYSSNSGFAEWKFYLAIEIATLLISYLSYLVIFVKLRSRTGEMSKLSHLERNTILYAFSTVVCQVVIAILWRLNSKAGFIYDTINCSVSSLLMLFMVTKVRQAFLGYFAVGSSRVIVLSDSGSSPRNL